MMNDKEGCIAVVLACIVALALCAVMTFGVACAIAWLVVSMGFLQVGVFKLALLICLVKMMFFDYHVNLSDSWKKRCDE